MRFLMKVSMSVESANRAARDGFQVIPRILDQVKPEAAYFLAEGGWRTALLIVNMDNTSEIPGLAEPWFLALNASIEMQPVMLPEDLAAAGPAIEQAVKDFG